MPWGAWLSRDLSQHGHACGVVAPSLRPQTAGDRVTTARRDTVHLARLRRSGDLTPVDVPQVADEAIRDLTGAREEVMGDRKTATFRLNPCLLRAVPLVAKFGDLLRFDHPRQLLKSRGLIPSAYARGERRRQGTIPTAGHPQARCVLVAGASADRYHAQVRRHWPLWLARLPKPSQDVRWTAQVQLCTRDRQLLARGTHANHVLAARS
jgi:transposase